MPPWSMRTPRISPDLEAGRSISAASNGVRPPQQQPDCYGELSALPSIRRTKKRGSPCSHGQAAELEGAHRLLGTQQRITAWEAPLDGCARRNGRRATAAPAGRSLISTRCDTRWKLP